MPYSVFKKLVEKHKGWIEGDVARFPSPWHKEQFEKEFLSA